MTEVQRLIVAGVLSLVILGLWQYFYVLPQQEVRMKYKAEQEEKRKQEAAKNGELTLDGVLEGADGAREYTGESVVLQSREEVLTPESKNQRIRISTDKLHGSINLNGGLIDDLTLANYHVSLEPDSPEVVLLSPPQTQESYYLQFGWLANTQDIALPDKNTQWTTRDTLLSADSPVTLRWDNGQGFTFIRTIALDEDYLFTVTDRIENTTNRALAVYPFSLANRIRPDSEFFFISHEGALGVFDGTLEERTYDDLKDESTTFKDVQGWIGIGDKYWLTAILPPQSDKIVAKASHYERHQAQHYQVDVRGDVMSVPAGGSLEYTQHAYAGAKRLKLLDKYGEKLNLTLFDRAIDYGWLYFLTRPMFEVLRFLHGMSGSFGMAILIMTVIVKLLLFPLANKSYVSMAKMRQFMPELQRIRERYKNDKQKMNEMMMKFYQEKKINPASGCFPILLQIPIFFALYKVLFVTIEMRHADFFGWINDLSAPDPTSVFNLFGVLPFEPVGWLPDIGLWPILFAATMFVQQLLNPPPTDPTQKIVMRWLPIILLFVFAGFPAGLVIYWTWSNVLSILQQYIITRRLGDKYAVAKAE